MVLVAPGSRICYSGRLHLDAGSCQQALSDWLLRLL